MEFVSLRERMKLDELMRDARYEKLLRQHAGQSFGANIPNHPDQITPEFVRSEIASRPRDYPRQHQPSRAGADDYRPQFPC